MVTHNTQIIDDFLPSYLADSLEFLLTSDEFCWYYYDKSTKSDSTHSGEYSEYSLFSHVFALDNKSNSNYMDRIYPITERIEKTVGEIKNAIRIKANLTFPSPLDDGNPEPPHVDWKPTPPDLSAIYYVNDSDGDTILYDQKYPSTDSLSISERVEHKKNRLLIFDGRTYHSSNIPKKYNKRININFALEMK